VTHLVQQLAQTFARLVQLRFEFPTGSLGIVAISVCARNGTILQQENRFVSPPASAPPAFAVHAIQHTTNRKSGAAGIDMAVSWHSSGPRSGFSQRDRHKPLLRKRSYDIRGQPVQPGRERGSRGRVNLRNKLQEASCVKYSWIPHRLANMRRQSEYTRGCAPGR